MAVSALIQYFTLAAFMWMGAEALLLFSKLIIVHVRITAKHIIATSAICWSKYLHASPVLNQYIHKLLKLHVWLSEGKWTLAIKYCFAILI